MVAPFTPLTLPQFSAKFVEALQARHPQLPVEIISDSELRIPSGDSHNTIFLDNAYKTYLQDPEAEQDIIHRFLASVVMTGEDRPLDRERIVPVIKDVAWIQEIQASMAARGNDKAIPFVSEPFNDSLVIVYAQDNPENLEYVTPDALAKAHLQPKDLRALACANLKRLMPSFELRGEPGFYMVMAGGTFEASLLLFDALWTPEYFEVQGDFVVAIPSRELLFITGSENLENVERLREIAREARAEAGYPLTDELFIRRGNTFVPFPE